MGHPTGYIAAGYFAQLIRLLVEGAALADAVHLALKSAADVPEAEETTRAIERAFALSASARPPEPETVEELGGGWIAEEAVAIGLYASLVARDFEHGVLLAVNHSGDSDSTGSIAGNILGLIHGEEAIPSRWRERVELRDVITELADDLWETFVNGTGSGRSADPSRYPPT
jgi:ADP-ribosylglycohydrolase